MFKSLVQIKQVNQRNNIAQLTVEQKLLEKQKTAKCKENTCKQSLQRYTKGWRCFTRKQKKNKKQKQKKKDWRKNKQKN